MHSNECLRPPATRNSPFAKWYVWKLGEVTYQVSAGGITIVGWITPCSAAIDLSSCTGTSSWVFPDWYWTHDILLLSTFWPHRAWQPCVPLSLEENLLLLYGFLDFVLPLRYYPFLLLLRTGGTMSLFIDGLLLIDPQWRFTKSPIFSTFRWVHSSRRCNLILFNF